MMSLTKLFRAAGTVAFALLLGQAAGLLSRILVARTFGTQASLDAFYAANRVAETLFLLVGGGALGSAFIPTFTELLVKKEEISAWELASGTATLLGLTLALLAGLAAWLAPQIVRYALAPGLAQDSALLALTVRLVRIQLLTSVLFGLGGLTVGILNARNVFFVPALMPAVYQLGWIFGVLLLAPAWGIDGLAWGVVLGSALYWLLQLPWLAQQGGKYTFSPSLGLENPHVRQVMRLMAPRLFGVAIVQLNFWVNIWLASQMPAGSISALTYGFTLMLMAQAVIAQSAATVLLPTLSGHFALAEFDELRIKIGSALNVVFLLALPAALGLILLGMPLIATLFERGSFTPDSTRLVYAALFFYALGLPAHALLEILARTFYAFRDTKTPVLVGAGAMTLNILFSLWFARLFSAWGIPAHGGLALANSLATWLEMFFLLALMQKRLPGGLRLRNFLPQMLLALLAGAAMGLTLFFAQRWLAFLPAWALTGAGVSLGMLVYGLFFLPGWLKNRNRTSR